MKLSMNKSQFIKSARKEHICSFCYCLIRKKDSYYKKIIKIIDEDGSKNYDNQKLCINCMSYQEEVEMFDWDKQGKEI